LARAHAIGFVVVLNNQDYEAVLRGRGMPKKVSVDSRYGVCIRVALGFLGQSATTEGSTEISIVVERGHKNMGSAVSLHQEMQDIAAPNSHKIQSVAFAPKERCWELQIADLLASTSFHVEQARYQSAKKPGRLLIPPSLLGKPHIHYQAITREDLNRYKVALMLVAGIKRRYGKSWRSAIRGGSLAVEGLLRLSEDPSSAAKWIHGLPLRRWFRPPS